MRFSLRTILLVFVIVGLALGLFVSSRNLQRVEEEAKRIRNAYGLGGPNRYQLTFIGPLSSSVTDSIGIHLLRLDDPRDYVILVFRYERDGQITRIATMELSGQDLEFAIWRDLGQTLMIESLRGDETTWGEQSDRTKDAEVFSYPYSDVDSEIQPGPFLTYFFCPPKVMNETNFQKIAFDEAKLKAWCQQYKAEAIYFEFKRASKK